jgi:hypothetical protein
MGRQKEYKNISIDVEPFLSIMAIVLKLISLILVVIVMRIAVNKKGIRVVALAGLWDQSTGNTVNPKVPSYIDCGENGVVLYPGARSVSWEQMQHPGNAVEQLLDRVQAKKETDYIVVMVRPKSVKFYRTIRSLLNKRPIDVGYDVVDSDFKVDWDEANKALAVAD